MTVQQTIQIRQWAIEQAFLKKSPPHNIDDVLLSAQKIIDFIYGDS